jgi:hypothetical protein
MAAYSNVLAFNADTESLGVASNVLAYDATTGLSGVTGAAAFAASLIVAFSGSGTVANPVASNVIAFDATTQAYASNVLAFDATTASEEITGTGAFAASFTLGVASSGSGEFVDGVENLGSGQDFPLSIAYAFDGEGVVVQPQAATGTASAGVSLAAAASGEGTADNPGVASGSGSQSVSLAVAGDGTGSLAYSFSGSGAQSASLEVVSSGTGAIVPPADVSGTGDCAVQIAYSSAGRGTEAVPFHMGQLISAPITDAPTVLRARMRGEPEIYTATLLSTVNFPGVS